MSSEFWDFLKFLKILTLWPSRFQLWWLRKIEIFERYQNLRLVTDSDWLIIDEYCQDFVSLRAFHVIDFNIKGKLYFITNYIIYNSIKTLLILGYHIGTLWFFDQGRHPAGERVHIMSAQHEPKTFIWTLTPKYSWNYLNWIEYAKNIFTQQF